MIGSVVLCVAMPPPIHGQALVNSRVVRGMQEFGCPIALVDTSPKSVNKGFLYHGRRVSGLLRGCFSVAKHSGGLYTVLESGLGRIYNLVLLAIARLLRRRIFIHHHTASHLVGGRAFATMLVMKVAGGDAIHIALSDGMARDIESLYGVRAITVHNAGLIDFGEFVELGSEEGVFHLGFLANITIEKGVLDLFEIFRSLLSSGFDAILHVAGPINDEQSQCAINAAASEFGARFIYHGRVDSEQKEAFFRGLHAFIFPSRYKHEAQPLVLLEAMSFGVPAFTTDVGYSKGLVPSREYHGVGVEGLLLRVSELLGEWREVPSSYIEARRLAYNTASGLREQSFAQFERLIILMSARA